MQNVAASEIMLDPAVFDPTVFNPAIFEPAALEPDGQAVKPRTAAPGKALLRTLLLKWDMIAVITLMLVSAVYGVYAVCFLTGF